MTPGEPHDSSSIGPTPEMLAGLYVCAEGVEDLAVRPYAQPESSANGAGKCALVPTPERLAGLYLAVEGPEDLAVYSAVGRSTRPPAKPIQKQ